MVKTSETVHCAIWIVSAVVIGAMPPLIKVTLETWFHQQTEGTKQYFLRF
ncbi:MAG: hypothetical protein KatS3mg114_1165 [Planctomycetaceae bacterium]|nr:MAG: hypothetical protein KatS3mg114_1165 [Planctomycetaceae bacterium]